MVSNPLAKKTTSWSGCAARQVHRLLHAVDDVDRAALALGVGERLRRARHPEHVAVGRDAVAGQRQRDRLVHLRHVGDADRAARAHDHAAAPGGAAARSPKRAMACSWLPQTCITEIGERPIAATSRASAVAERARPGGVAELELGRALVAGHHAFSFASRRGLHLAAHVLGHEVAGAGVLQHLLEERQRLPDLVGRDAADGEPDVVEHVVTDGDRLVDDVEPEQSSSRRRSRRWPPGRSTASTLPGTPRHMTTSFCRLARRARARVRDERLAERDAAVAGRDRARAGIPANSGESSANMPSASRALAKHPPVRTTGQRAVQAAARRTRSAAAATRAWWKRAATCAAGRQPGERRAPRRGARSQIDLPR